jgi:hypothetical protein
VVTRANWADPENTTSDIRIVSAAGQPWVTAKAPKLTASANEPADSPAPTLSPARQPPADSAVELGECDMPSPYMP